MTPAPGWKQTRRWLLGHLPGAAGLRYRTKYRLGLPHDAAGARFEAALARAAGTTCIDLGANVGTITRRLAARAARVIAVEPDPDTAQHLRQAVADLPQVEVLEVAAGLSEGCVQLYRHAGYDPATGARSEGSSTMAGKTDLGSASVTVRQIDFLALLNSLPGPIGILKIDIEGAEVPLLEALLDHPALTRIDHIFCETHEKWIPELVARTDRLHRRVAKLSRPKIDLSWH